MARALGHLHWPRSLEAAAAVDTLARIYYESRCRYYGAEELAWVDVPMHIRSGLVELAVRTLRRLGPPSMPSVDASASDPDALFQMATDLARAEARKVVGYITPDEPYGVDL